MRDRPSRSYERVFILAKRRRCRFAERELSGSEIAEDLWPIPVQTRPHESPDTVPNPDQLVKRFLDIGCSIPGIPPDPFMGGGTTVRVALSTEHSGIGIDRSEAFYRCSPQVLD